ncbi:methylmalonyl-CoA mutase family protein [Rhabdaerophilum sp. SD176]|uniref:methylmalonyl-CoA mutase family protein n=1 Tax=Rhabdaerophilum sp. SD176 TaxID=2983548 RepID=UPI0024DFC4EB|nr:methylmalonyl-CoA mutase family protein [Rhabdaerophilum sp. SD176]
MTATRHNIFPPTTEADWRKAVEQVLKGADFEKVMVGRTSDGLPVLPLHPRRKDVEAIAGPRGAERWRIAARIADPDADRGNGLLHEDLLGGADMITATLAGSPQARGFGLREPSPATWSQALRNVHCDLVSLRLEGAPFGGRALADSFAAFAQASRLPGATLKVDFGLQPLADFAALGHFPLAFGTLMANALEIIRQRRAEGFAGPFLRCDSRPFHEAGATEAQELALLAAQGVTYLRALEEANVPLEEASNWLSFTLAVDDDFFLGIAKLRALRLLWARIEEASGLSPAPVAIHAETAWRMLTRHDVHVNLLRNTIAAFAAGIGGADSIEVLPFTAPLGLADAAARRLARNTSLILLDESSLARMLDPAAGAGSIEAMTDALAEKAWSLFGVLEGQAGNRLRGMPAALENGFVAEMLRDARDARLRLLATRRQPLTGVSEFPDLTETPPAVLAEARPHAAPEGALPSLRLAEPFEHLRDRAIRLGHGKPPRVFLANLGRVADFTARATFAKSFFEVAGIEGLGNGGFADAGGKTDLAALLAAFRASGAAFACLASSDEVYRSPSDAGEDSLAVAAAKALHAAGARQVWLAGRPGPDEAAYRAAGISGFSYVGCDVLASLEAALDAIGT